MAVKSNSQRLAEIKRKREEEQKTSSSAGKTLRNSDRAKKLGFERTINFDTFQSDLENLGATVKSVYDGWQTGETMNNTRSSIESMQKRLDAYSEYQKMFGGADLTDVSNSYKSILEDWDNRTTLYGGFKNADAFEKSRKTTEFDRMFTGLSYDEVQELKKSYAPDSDAYKYLDTYTNYSDLNDFNKAIESANKIVEEADAKNKAERDKITSDERYKKTKEAYDNWQIPKVGAWNEEATKEKGVITYYTQEDVDEAKKSRDAYMKNMLGGKTFEEVESYENDALKESSSYLKDLETKKNTWALDNAFDLYKDVMQNADFEENSKYVSTKGENDSKWQDTSDRVYEYINDYDGETRTRLNHAHDVYQSDAPIYTPSKYAEMGLDYLTKDEIKTYNYLYNESKASADKFLSDMQTTLNKRRNDETTKGIRETVDNSAVASALLSVASVPMNIAGSMYSTISAVSGDNNPYSIYNSLSNAASDIRTEVGQNIAESTEGFDFLGQNVPQFLYQTAMSMGDTIVGGGSMGKMYSPIMGMSAFQQKAREMKEAGENDGVVFKTALASGVAEMLFEYVSFDKLIKIKNVDSKVKIIINGLKQAGIEASEEMATELANIISDHTIRGENSELWKKYEDLKARGYSDGEINVEIAKQVGSQVGWAGAGGFLSGAVMGGSQAGQNYHSNKVTGNTIRGNERIQDLLDVAQATPTESETYNMYNEYALKNNPDNITDAQIGALYSQADMDAESTLHSRKASINAKASALRTKMGLRVVDTENTIAKRTKELAKEGETNSGKIEGIKIDGDNTSVITESGEVAIESGSLSQRNAELVARAEQIAKIDGEDAANIFLAQDDGVTDLEDYHASFNLVYTYAKNNYTQDVILAKKGTLSTEQVKGIYESTVKATFDAQQKVVDEVTERQSKNVFVQGTVDDSVIDYDSKTTDGSKVNWNTLTSKQRKAIKFVQLFAKATGVNIKFTKSEIVKNEKTGELEHKGENGEYDPYNNTITLDVYAGRMKAADDKDFIIPVLSHEMTHWMKAKAPSIYNSIRDDIVATLGQNGRKTSEDIIKDEIDRMDRNHPETKHTPEDAIDELVARACEDMLANSEALKNTLSKMSDTEQQTFIDKVKETFENLIQWVNDLLGLYKSESEEAKILREYKEMFEQISKKWDAMLVSALASNQALQSEGIIAEKLVNGISKDGTTIVGKNKIQMSERTYENGGRDFLIKWMDEQDLSKEDKEDILRQTDMIKSLMEDIRKNNELPDYARWAEMDVVKDENGEKVLSVIVKNGDYAMNIDFSQVCKKRVALNAVLNAMVQSGDLNAYTLTETDVADLNAIIKEHDFEIACALCFVDSKRYRVGSWAESFCEGADKVKNKKTVHQYGFNEMVRSLIPKDSKIQIDEFNFTNREIIGQPTSNLLSEMDDSELDFTLIDEILEREYKPDGKNTDLYAYAKAIKDNKELRKILNPAEIISSIGLDAIRLESPELYRLINRHQGTAKPKFAHDVVAYANDILKASNFTKEKAKYVGGVRCQSFSDFMANMVFDYVQFISELSAKELTAHTYTKEPLFVKLFGLTGMKINMSLVPKAIQMTPEQQKYFAILNDPKANKRSAEYKKAKRDYEKLAVNAGLDANGNYIWEDETFPYDVAMDIVVDPRYSANCGTIAVGISDNHILKLINDERISMVIPYHKSGLNRDVAMMRNIDLYNDYTSTQNTRFANGKKLDKVPDFDFYGDLYGRDGKEGTHDPKKTADNYLKWCDEHNYIPKFEKSRIGRRFRDNPNYYKLLVDFRVYDTDGTYREQQPVKPIYPENEEFKELLLNGVVDKNGKVYGGLNQQQKTSDKLDAESKQIVKEFKQVLEKKHGKDVLKKQNADRGVYAPTFYSHMGETIDEMKQDKVGATSVVPYLKGRGVKDEEIKWSGIETFLEGKKSVTKAELQEFVNNSMLQIEEQTSGGNIEDVRAKADSLTAAIEQAMPHSVDSADMQEYIMGKATEFDRGSITKEELEDDLYNTITDVCMDNLAPSDDYGGFFEWQESKEWAKIVKAMDDIVRTVTSQTRWNEYILDGGSNYREITFKMPNSTYTNSAMKAHWGDKAKGILAHARIQDFEVNGKKMLFVEEIQSDWHNMGHKVGYKSDVTSNEVAKLKEIESQISMVEDEMDAVEKERDAFLERYWAENLSELEYNRQSREYREREYDLRQKQQDLYRERNEYKVKIDNAAPDAPFRTTYHEYVLKRLIRMAAENGYDSIGWTTADIQSERWSDEFAEGYRIEYDQDMPKFLKKYGKQWGAKVEKTVLDDESQQSVSYVISTDIWNDGQYYASVEEAVEVLVEETNENFGTEFSAENVDIYEWDDVVRVFDEETGDEIGTLRVEYGTPDSRGSVEVWSMPITDSMKESVLYKGQVMYADRVIPTGIELPEGTKVDKNGKPRSAQAQRDAGYMLSEDKFYQLYSAHKLTYGNRGEEIKSVIDKIKKDGFISSTSIANVLPTSTMRHFDYDDNGKVKFANVVQFRYAPKKGDYILFVPNNYVTKDDIIKNGFKPLDYEIVAVEYDYQTYYELYTKAYNQAYEQTNATPNLDMRYADRFPDDNWHTGMSNAEVSFIERIAKHEVETTENYIDAGNKWLYNDRKDKPYFALYSTAHIDNPTVMYASKGNQATKDYKWLMDFVAEMEMTENGRDDLRRKTINEVLIAFGYALDKGSLHSGKPTSPRNNRNVGVHRSASGVRPSEALLICIRNIGEKQERESGLKKSYADRMEETIYDKMGETERVLKENEKLKADVERLKERLKIERQVTHGNYFNENQLNTVAGHLRNIAMSDYSKPKLVELLKEVYSYIAHSETLNWQDMFAQCCDVARTVLSESRETPIVDDYVKGILNEIRKTRISLNEKQKSDAKRLFGDRYLNAFMGKVIVAEDGVPLDVQWQIWSEAYPGFFDGDVQSDTQHVAELYDALGDLKKASEYYAEYDKEEQVRWLAKEIYNQYWNVSTIKTTADRYDKQIKRLNFEHRKTMSELRSDYEDRMSEQKKTERERAKKLVAKIREDTDKKIADIKQRSKERMDEYKENAEKKTKIQSITANALTLNKWLKTNSKDHHIHEAMKEPVVKLLQAIDFSSKQMLEKGNPTQKDVTFAKAFAEVEKMLIKAEKGEDGLVELYGHDLGEGIKALVDAADRLVGDNNYVINKMTLEELNHLDKLVKYIKKVVTDLNKFHVVNHAKGIANMSQESMVYLDKLGKAKVFDGLRGGAKKLIEWGNALPYYVFKRYGKGGQKIFEAFQDGWDKFAFHIKEIIDYSKKAYTSKEVKEWSNDIKTFKVLVPATDIEKSDPNYKPSHQTMQMSVSQIMSLYCLSKREQARNHILQGGIRIADIKGKKGAIISQSDGIVLTYTDVANIIGTLSVRQKAVADKLQEFMNTVCTDWGNEVSMMRFGYKAFGEENYFPIQSDKNNLAVNDETEQNNSLFRLLNMSFTKALTDNANNRVVISDIFDVFAQHTSDMAKYNALALPVLDAFKWYNYNEKIEKGDGTFITKGVKQSIESAFGKDGQNYFTTFMKDLNGEKEVTRDTLGKHFFTNAKIAAVGMNLRVMALQPTSYLRASAVIDNKYLTKALLHKPKIDKAETHCGMALWKSMGYYDTNVQKGVEEQIKHEETFKDKATEWSMKGAELADKLTWGYLWNACELEIREKRKDLKVGSEEFYKEIGKRLREVIYATQVVDSTMTRSQMMRSNGMYDKMLTAFASEPTLAYNMLQDAYMGWHLDARSEGKKQAWKNNGKKIARVVTAYTLTNVMAAIIEAGFDAFRDDDEEMDLAEFMKMFLTNFANDMSITAKIPIVKEVHSIAQGFGSSRTDTQWVESFIKSTKAWWKVFNGDGNPEKATRQFLKAFSDLSGLPFFNAYRDFMAALDKLNILTAEEIEEMFK